VRFLIAHAGFHDVAGADLGPPEQAAQDSARGRADRVEKSVRVRAWRRYAVGVITGAVLTPWTLRRG
jgi:hypothetical protein